MNADWLTQLAPAHAPPPPGWWPLAPGWWGLALLLLLFSAALSYRWQRPSARLRRAALRELEQLEARVGSDAQLAGELQNLMRRYAIAAYGHATVAGLSGNEWLAFIETHGGTVLAGEVGRNLLDIAYGKHELAIDRACWLEGVQGFLRGKR
jgi:hypothetical protein